MVLLVLVLLVLVLLVLVPLTGTSRAAAKAFAADITSMQHLASVGALERAKCPNKPRLRAKLSLTLLFCLPLGRFQERSHRGKLSIRKNRSLLEVSLGQAMSPPSLLKPQRRVQRDQRQGPGERKELAFGMGGAKEGSRAGLEK